MSIDIFETATTKLDNIVGYDYIKRFKKAIDNLNNEDLLTFLSTITEVVATEKRLYFVNDTLPKLCRSEVISEFPECIRFITNMMYHSEIDHDVTLDEAVKNYKKLTSVIHEIHESIKKAIMADKTDKYIERYCNLIDCSIYAYLASIIYTKHHDDSFDENVILKRLNDNVRERKSLNWILNNIILPDHERYNHLT